MSRARGVSGVIAALTLAVSATLAAQAPAWATRSTADPVPAPSAAATPSPAPTATPTPAPSSSATPAPTPTAPSGSTSGTVTKGCQGVTPMKPWRLIAMRPTPVSTQVKIEWSIVGCTTGYRVIVEGAGVQRTFAVAGGASSSLTVPDLVPSIGYRITVTSVGTAGDGGTSGGFLLRRSGPATDAELAIDFPDAVPAGLVPAGDSGAGPWRNPLLSWTPPDGPLPTAYRIEVVGQGGATVVDRTVTGSAVSVRLGDDIVAGVAYRATVTPVRPDGTTGSPARLTFGDDEVPAPERVTGVAPAIQFTPVSEIQEGRLLGYEIAYGTLKATTHVFLDARSTPGAEQPWVAVDPTFNAAATMENRRPPAFLVTVIRAITTMGKSKWTVAQTLSRSEVINADTPYYAGIARMGDGTVTAPRYGFLSVRGRVADVQVSDFVWARDTQALAVPVTVAVFGPMGSAAPAFVQDVPVTRLPNGILAWRISEVPLPDAWTSVVLRRGGSDVVRWHNAGLRACVAAVTFTDAPTDLPAIWRDFWCR